MQAVLDRPVSSEEVGEPGRAGLLEGEAGDRVDRHGPPPLGVVLAQVPGLAGDLDDLGGMREPEPADRDRLEGSQLDPTVGAVASAVQLGDRCQGRPAQRSRSVG